MYYIAVDPSGSFNEGKGKTGVAMIKDDDITSLTLYSFDANKYKDRMMYWKTMIKEITAYPKDSVVIIESFVVRNNGFLVGKMPETPLFIGALIWELEQLNIPYVFQSPSQAKTRFKDEYLGRYIPKYEVKDSARGKLYYINGKLLNDHQRDAIKHLLYYIKYNKGE